MAPRRLFACFGRGGGASSATGGASPEANATADLTAEEQRRMGPVLVELFASQGCAASPEAEAVVAALARGGQEDHDEEGWGWGLWLWRSTWSTGTTGAEGPLRVEHVDGAAEGLRGGAAPRHALHPQAVVHGRAHCLGADREAIISAVQSAPRFPSPTMQATFQRPSPETLQVSFSGQLRTKVDSHGADVMVALYENGLVTDCTQGENKGRVLPNDHVVRHPPEATLRKGRLCQEEPLRLRSVCFVGWIQSH
uniref:Uncharacterized protein n=1 Tax=Ananas comosus var. bracteatus TaxID=296719 RepID=A0A6V7PEW8_ANACO|nr:unnamed protein product [Ananas comosus var. bracteatus]